AAHLDRGLVWHRAGHPGRAITDYTVAIGLAPRSAIGYCHRARAWRDRSDLARALGDFGEALRLDPQHADAYFARGKLLNAMGDRRRALADLNAALELEPGLITALRPIGVDWFGRGDFALAAELMRIGDGNADAHAVLFRFLARARGGAEAGAELAANAAKVANKAWPYPLIELFLGGRSPHDALAIAGLRPHERLEALFHIGQWHLLRGNRREAKANFRVVAARYPHHLPECTIARTELKRLRRAGAVRAADPTSRSSPS